MLIMKKSDVSVIWSSSTDSNAFHDNQDSIKVIKSKNICAIADGVTGGIKGKEASEIAVNVIERYDQSEDIEKQLVSFFKKSDNRVKSLSTDMNYSATTLVIGIIRDNMVHFGSVGDSSVIIKSKNNITCLTDSDRIGMAGLLHTIGTGFSTIHYKAISVTRHDVIIFSTDGLTDNLSLEEINHIIEKGTPEYYASELVNVAIKKEYKKDDISVITAFIQ